MAKEVETYTPKQVERMFEVALETDMQFLPFLTLGFFCGIRPDGELPKLQWTDVRLDGEPPQIVVRPEVSKTKRRRFVDLSPNAVAWIEAYRQSGHPLTGEIVPFSQSTLRRKRDELCAKTRINWVQQGMRHTYCSNWLALYGDINKLVLQSGHDSVDTMWRHYHRGTTKAEAEKFWSIRPPTPATNIVPMARIGRTRYLNFQNNHSFSK